MIRLVLAFVVVLGGAIPVGACPVCESATGERVRAGIFDADFGYHLVVTLLPFLVFVGIVRLIHFGPPWVRDGPRADPPPDRERA